MKGTPESALQMAPYDGDGGGVLGNADDGAAKVGEGEDSFSCLVADGPQKK